LVIFLFLKKWYFKFQSLVNEESFVYVKIWFLRMKVPKICL
jgi:hypothetical protein